MRVKKQYPGAGIFATTLRQVLSANEHMWGSILLDGNDWYVAEPRPLPVLDRIGGGDGFVGGLLYGVLKGFCAEDALHFGWATGVLATTCSRIMVSRQMRNKFGASGKETQG